MYIADKIEAVLFVCGTPVTLERLSEIFELPPDEIIPQLKILSDRLETDESGLQLACVDGAYQICTKSSAADVVKKALEMRRTPPLSRAALEVLAVIAYNQPASRSFIEQVRGTDSSSIVSSLAEKGLIYESGRLEAPGRPVLFSTTDVFLRCFGLSSLSELPELPADLEPNSEQIKLDIDGQASESEGEGESP